MIKAMLFDAGGVIVKTGNQISMFARIFRPKNKQKLWEKINHYNGPLCAGKMSEKEYWRIIAKSEGIDPGKIPDNLWAKNYEKTTKIDPKMVSLLKRLRKRYKTILISNTIKPHVIINKKRGLFDNFDDVINSNEVHLSKDTKAIFKLALKRNHLKAKECIFIDDIQKFVDIAKSAGIHGIRFRNVRQLKKELSRLGVL
ncbi:MAG: HAD family phosphatase [Candidatus Nanoarchaeia archaeon]|nr:HAD family phosphatase [Candidatus Nanoarchaeia archaeon]